MAGVSTQTRWWPPRPATSAWWACASAPPAWAPRSAWTAAPAAAPPSRSPFPSPRERALMAEAGKISVIIADDHPIVRMGLRALIEAQPDMVLLAEAEGGAAAVEAFTQHRPDVMLVDLRMPGMSGRDVITAVRGTIPDARIIVLTSFDGDEDVFRAVQAGARGYLLKAAPPDDVIKAV